MYELLGSKTKTEIFNYLIKNPYKTVKEISHDTKIGYKYTSKILNEFVEKRILDKESNKFFMKSEFIVRLKRLSDLAMKRYSKDFVIRNNLDKYNAFLALYPDDKITKEIDGLMDTWLMKKLDDWYSKWYDPEDLEYKKLKEIITNNFNQNINILEVGTGSGRLTFKLAKDFEKITALEKDESQLNYVRKKSRHKNIKFINKSIEEFETEEKFDVIFFSWMGLHYLENIELIFRKIKKQIKKDTIIIIFDAYYKTEYIEILNLIDPRDLKAVMEKKSNLHDLLIKEFGNVNQEVLFTKYKFHNVKELVNYFKIELTLEESYIWTREEEDKIKKYLEKKKNPLQVQEGVWISVIKQQ